MMRSAPALLCAVMFVVGCSSDGPDAGAVATSTTGAPAAPTSETPSSTTVVSAPTESSVTTAMTAAAPLRTVRLEQFQTPTKNIACLATGEEVRCDIQERSWQPPPRPADCDRELDWGNGFSILPEGTTTGNCATDTVLNRSNPVLAYGEASTVGAISCVSRLDGLTCTHARTRRGFFLSRESYKLF